MYLTRKILFNAFFILSSMTLPLLADLDQRPIAVGDRESPGERRLDSRNWDNGSWGGRGSWGGNSSQGWGGSRWDDHNYFYDGYYPYYFTPYGEYNYNAPNYNEGYYSPYYRQPTGGAQRVYFNW